MRNFLLLLSCIIFTGVSLQAQVVPSCGFDKMKFDAIEKLEKKASNPLAKSAADCNTCLYTCYDGTNCGAPTLPNPGCPLYQVPLVFTVFEDPSWTGSPNYLGASNFAAITDAQIMTKVAELNAAYAPTQMEFFMCQDIIRVTNADLYDYHIFEPDPVDGVLDNESSFDIPNVINVYLTGGLDNDHGPSGFGGFAPFPGGRDYTVMKYSSMLSGSLVLEHELGHYFGLEHPHNGSDLFGDPPTQANEAADNSECCNYGPNDGSGFGNASNPINIGDGICDTNAEPNLLQYTALCGPNACTQAGYLSTDCSLAGPSAYTVNPTNIMSYTSACASSFTPCQIRKMHDILLSCRSNLCCSNPEQYFAAVDINTDGEIIETICLGDPAPTFTSDDACHDWFADETTTTALATNMMSFTPAVGTAAGQVDNNTSGEYTFYIQYTNAFADPPCRYPVTVVVSSDPGDGAEQTTGNTSITLCDGVANVTTDATALGTDEVIGWWLTDGSGVTIGDFADQTALDAGIGAATIGGPVSNPPDNIFESTAGTPTNEASIAIDCNNLTDGQTYYATPFVASSAAAIPDVVLDCTTNPSMCGNSFNVDFGCGGGIFLGGFNTGAISGAPASPPNDPIYTITITTNTIPASCDLSNILIDLRTVSSVADILAFFTPNSLVLTETNFPGYDPTQGFEIYLYDQTNACGCGFIDFDVDIEITYPGVPAIPFPSANYSNCLFGNPVEIVCDCACDASFIVDGTTSEEIAPLNTETYCVTDTDPTLVIVGDTGGTFSATPAGLSINASTGAIDVSASTPGTYQVDYDSPNTCTESITIVITAAPEAGTPPATPNVCNSSTSLIDLDALLVGADAGGTWTETSATASTGFSTTTDQADFNPSGQVAGTYTFDYTVAACSTNDIATITVEVVAAPEAGTPPATQTVCNSSSTLIDLDALLTGADAGGTWTETSATASTGFTTTTDQADFNPSSQAAGTYTFDYTVAASAPCTGSDIATITVQVDEVANAGTADPTLITCNIAGTGLIDLNGLLTGEDTAGTWTETSGMPSAGGVTAPNLFDPIGEAAATYTFEYTVTGGVCGNDTETVTIEIVDPCCDASFDYGSDPLALCETAASVTPTFADANGSFSAAPAGLTIDATTGAIDPTTSAAGTYTVTHTVNTNTGCTETLTVTIDEEVEAGTAEPTLIVCNIAGTGLIDLNGLLTGEDFGGAWSETSAVPSIGGVTAPNLFDPIGEAAGIYTFSYTVSGGACADDAEAVIVEIVDPCCDASFDYGSDPLSLCVSSATATPTFADANGSFSAAPAGLTIDATTGAIDPTTSTAGTYTVTHSVNTNIGCTETLTVTIDDEVSAGIAEPAVEVCNIAGTVAINLSDLLTGEDTGGTWTETSGAPSVGGVTAPNLFNPIGEVAGTYTFEYLVGGGACPDDTEIVTVTIIDPCCEAFAGDGVVTPALCPGDAIGVEAVGFNVDPNYNFYYVLIDATTGLIVEVLGGAAASVSSPINFATTTPGDYIVLIYSEEAGNGPTPAVAVGADINVVLGSAGCFDAVQLGGVLSVPTPFNVLGGVSNTLEGLSGGIFPVYYNNHQLLIGGGTPPYTYDWDRTGYVRWDIGGSTDPNFEEEITITYADNAEWAVTVTDANGCTDASLVFTNDTGAGGGNPSVATTGNILDIDDIDIQAESANNADGAVDITVVGCDGGPYTYEWSGPNAFTATTEDISGLGAGYYYVTVTCGDQVSIGYYWVPVSRNGGRLKMGEQGIGLSAYPNPFSQVTTIEFATQEGGNASVEIFDLTGRVVAELFNEQVTDQATYQIPFDATNLENGSYFCRLTIGDKESIIRLIAID